MPRPPDADRFAYADATRLLAETLDGLLPPMRIPLADHCTIHRWVKNSGTGTLELYDHAVAPYLRGIMEALDDPTKRTVAAMGPAASGKTAGPGESWLLRTIHSDPAEMLWYMQTEAARDAYVQARIEPLLDDHAKLIGDLRYGRDSIALKRFRGGRVEFLPFTASTLINKHVRYIIADEWDAYDESVGDPKEMLDFRRQAAGAESKLLAISHPDRARPLTAPPEQQRGIMRLYVNSDRRTWWWQCPHCGGWSSPNPGAARRMVIDYRDDAPLDEIEASARLLCPVSGCLIEDKHRRAMNGTGRWLCAGEAMDEDGAVTGAPIASETAGFWIHGSMSAFLMGGIGALARKRAAAERAIAAGQGDAAELRTVLVKGWGEPLPASANLGTVEAATLVERAEPALRLGVVPEGVRFLTAWADAQANRWEMIVRGWGVDGESWIVDTKVIPGEPATSGPGWDALLARLIDTTYPLADGSGRHMRVRAAGFDSMGQPGVTEQAYAAWLRRRLKGQARKLGTVEGRDAWNIVPTKGNPGRYAARLMLAYPNSQRKDRKSTARGQVPLLLFGANAAKDALAAQLMLAPPAANSLHIPAALLAPKGPPHPFIEGMVAEKRDPLRGTWSPIAANARNEPMDMLVGAEVVARLHGLHRINWDKPPAWAGPWETNSMIVDRETEVHSPAPAANMPMASPAPARQVPAATPAAMPPAIAMPRAAMALAARLAG